ncbi:transcriptional regulator GlxA family with amidase domain [Bradyrhizobium sp. JR4.1]|uniref:GlxA family transcriptional regulator n=1 Tax=Bradyrhizobium sp. JR4.1 TaxID=3156372 RepID=UPI00339A0345
MADTKIKKGSFSGKLPGRKLAVGFVLLKNFTLIAFSSIIDLLRLAADEGDRSRPERCSWSILAPELSPISASCGLQVAPWETFDRPERFDYIVVIGGLVDPDLIYDSRTLQFLRKAADRGVSIAGVCTGSFALAEAQLLCGRKCCVSWYHFTDFVERYADITPVANQLFIEDGKFITCAGGLAALDLAAWIVERHLGPGRAQKGLHIMITDKARLAANAQPQPPSMATVDEMRVRRAMLVIEQNLSTPPKTQDIASKVDLSKRQLERLFRNATGKSIQEFSRDLRIFYGLWLLAQSDKSITSIATESGFSDISHFNRIFRAAFGCTPSIARRNGIASMNGLIRSWQDKHAGSPGARFGPIGLSAADPLITSSGRNKDGDMIREIKIDAAGFLQRERRPYL